MSSDDDEINPNYSNDRIKQISKISIQQTELDKLNSIDLVNEKLEGEEKEEEDLEMKTSSSFSNKSVQEHNYKYNKNDSFLLKLIKSGELKTILISLSTILIYYCFSIFLTFYNRYLFVTYKYPLSITIIHLIFKYLASALVRWTLNCFAKKQHQKRITLDWMIYLKRILPTGIASAADIGFSNWSLQYITISLYTMSKSTVILFIFFFSIVFKLEKWVSLNYF